MVARHPRARRRGASLVEAALLLPMILLFLFSIFEYGRYLMVLHVANNAAREGARYAVAHTGDGTTKTQVLAVVDQRMASNDANLQGYARDVFTVDPAGVYNSTTGAAIYPPTISQLSGSNWNDARYGSPIAVQITGTYQPVLPSLATPFFKWVIMNQNMQVTVTAMMNSEAN
jgi:Flp pilus assembly protein TadG